MVVLEHAAVSRVSDVEVVRGVHHDSVGPAQRVGTSCGGAARGSETAMAEYEIGVRIASAALAAATVKRRMVEEQLTQTPVMLGLDSQRLLPRCSPSRQAAPSARAKQGQRNNMCVSARHHTQTRNTYVSRDATEAKLMSPDASKMCIDEAPITGHHSI